MADSGKKPKAESVNVGALQVAATYAKAFLGAAKKGNLDEAVGELSSFVTDVLDPFPQLAAVFDSALVSHEEKAELLDRLFTGKMSDLLLNFLKVISRRGRLDIVRAIRQEVERQYDDLRGRVRVHLSTAVPLANGHSSTLTSSLAKLLGSEPVVDSSVDPALIGGLVLRVGDTVYDGSVARQLRQLREQMINRSVHEIQSRRDRFRHPGGN